MDLICKLTDEDIGEVSIKMDNPRLRLGARGFVGKVLEDTKQLNITQKEKDEGAKLLWETPEKALKLITESYDKLVASKYESVYHTKFIVLRDRKILEKYIEIELFYD